MKIDEKALGNLIEHRSKFYRKKFRNEKFTFDENDIQSEIGLACAEAIRTYNPSRFNKASLKTYLCCAIRNKMNSYYRRVLSKQVIHKPLDNSMRAPLI